MNIAVHRSPALDSWIHVIPKWLSNPPVNTILYTSDYAGLISAKLYQRAFKIFDPFLIYC